MFTNVLILLWAVLSFFANIIFLELKQLHSSLLLLLLLLVVKVVILIIAIHGSHLCRFSKLPAYTLTVEIVMWNRIKWNINQNFKDVF